MQISHHFRVDNNMLAGVRHGSGADYFETLLLMRFRRDGSHKFIRSGVIFDTRELLE